MFTTGFLNKQNKSNMSFNQDINFHRAAKHLRSSTHSSPQRMLSCPNPGGTMHRFKPVQTGSNVSLNSACSSKDEGSSEESSDHIHNHHHHHHHHHHEEATGSGAFDRNQSLQSSFNSDHSSSRESDVGFQRSDDSPTISDVQPFTKSASTFATASPSESRNNDLIEMNELKSCQLNCKKKKKTKKSSKSSNSSASSVASDGSGNQATVVPSSSGSALDSVKDSSSSWYQFMMPSYKSRLSTFHSTFLNIPTTEALVDDFLCALHRDILLQGRLYVSVNYIAFYSNILGYETKVVIYFKDVKHISKATTIKLFHNAIEVYTFDGTKYFFTSFVSREKCFRVLKLLWGSASGLVEGQKIDWTEVCRIIRQNYSTQTLGANLTDLEDADLEKHLSKGKTVRKRLQKKKDKLKSMNNSSDSALSTKSQVELPDGDDDNDEYEDTFEEEATIEDIVDGSSSYRAIKHPQTLVNKNPFITQCRESVQYVTGVISPIYHRVRQNLESTRVYLCYAMIILIFCLHIHLLIRIGTVNERLEIFTNLAKQAMTERMNRQSLGLLAATNSQMVAAASNNGLQHNQQQLTTTLSTSSLPECSQCRLNLSPT